MVSLPQTGDPEGQRCQQIVDESTPANHRPLRSPPASAERFQTATFLRERLSEAQSILQHR